MTPADPDFILWWRLWRLMQSGNASPADRFLAAFHWRLSIEVRRRLGDLDI